MSPADDRARRLGRVRDLVEARLGRRPQDKLEAAVVLEAWGGIRPPFALDVAGDAVDRTDGRPVRSVANPRQPEPRDKAVVAEGLALLIAVVAVALWTLPFGRALGTDVWDAAVRLALPITLGGQWMLRSRYLGRPNGLAALHRDWLGAICVLAAGAGLAATQGQRGLVCGLLVVTWLGGTVLVRRGWALVYVALLVAVAVEVNLDVDPVPTLAATAGATLFVAVFVVAMAGSTVHAAGRPSRALAAGLMGAGIGGLLVLDTSVGWGSAGVLPALALVPSTAGSFWGGYHLWRFYEDVPRALAGVPVAEADRVSLRGPAMGVLGGAFGRLVGVTVVLSALTLLVAAYVAATPAAQGAPVAAAVPAAVDPAAARALGPLGLSANPQLVAVDAPAPPPDYAGQTALLAGFGLIALATLLISVLQSLGFPSWALFTLACALAAELAMSAWVTAPFGGTALVTGAAVAVLVAVPPVIGLFLRPGRVLATILWIS
jgi:hypothetical protein